MLSTKQKIKGFSLYCYVYLYEKNGDGGYLYDSERKQKLAFRIDLPRDHKEREWDSHYKYRIMPDFDNKISTLSAIVSTVKRLSKQWRDDGRYTRFTLPSFER